VTLQLKKRAKLTLRACKQYAILDECTSAVTLEVEQTFYERATGT
jgi:ABC-type uncharacterized transport system fused permease/ATPase subunit